MIAVNNDTWMLILLLAVVFGALVAITTFSGRGSLDSIKSKTVGDGQHGTARWATQGEIKKTFRSVPFQTALWRKGERLPGAQGLVLGCTGKKGQLTALVDSDDIHCLMIGASGVGKTAFFLYPNLEYACASGMSFFASDTKGDLARNYGAIARDCYGYQVAVVDLRNPTRSDGYNLLTLINHYMDACRRDPADLAARAKAEKYAKILSKTVINPDEENFAQNQYFYDAAEGVLTAVILLLAEYLPPKSTCESGGTSYQYSSWCRSCWPPAFCPARMSSSSSWTACRRNTRPSGSPAPPSPPPNSLWPPSCPPSSPG